ncbi:MAG: topoisomerase [Thermoplasmata archaeon]|nr:topoisomerase [Thermoplasmata archaeon]
MNPKETLERLEETLDELDHASKIMPIIVEGLKDRMALRSLNVNGHVIILNDGDSVFGTCENISRKWGAAIILTDWDHKGGQLARQLMDSLRACGISYDTEYRATISMWVKKDVKDVEGLPPLIRRLRTLAGSHTPIF